MIVTTEDPAVREDVRALLEEHLAEMYATSPPESVHALDLDALRAPAITFWTARASSDGTLLGCGALKELGAATEGEIKSMRTAAAARGQGVAAAVLAAILTEAKRRDYVRINLETGAEDFFAPARRLYARHGFLECGPFADYVLDPNSVFMTLPL